ncbi:MAG: DUF3011 domain-containing protein [Bdellovibrio sp.]|nr:DUF3011 domain-containing protein [Bdellovibrio sp.]
MTPNYGGKMKNIFMAFLLVCGLAPLAHADINDNMDNAETSYIRPGPRPAPYPGNPNPGRPDPYPGNPGPRPRPNPGYPPPPPPAYRYEYLSCSSYNYRYNECYFSPYGVAEVRIYSQHSYEACIWGRTAGVYNDRIWVDRGCSATFEIIRY